MSSIPNIRTQAPPKRGRVQKSWYGSGFRDFRGFPHEFAASGLSGIGLGALLLTVVGNLGLGITGVVWV